MAKITAFAKIFRDWEALLGACDKNAGLLPGVDPMKGSVETLLAQLKDLKIRQEDLVGQRKALTQSLAKVLADGRDAARKLRDFVRVQLGARSEQLTQFGVSPLRPKKAKATAQAKKPAPAPPPAAAGAMETGAPQNPTAP